MRKISKGHGQGFQKEKKCPECGENKPLYNTACNDV